ncbi:FecR family protein [Flavivirga spongiicola]|uniref:FecR family protein n=1 Tax=Flavivirga spongiicola TaxID=421621 RepID=A0ABU7XYF9_9FLAO|nr:FecR family protein [Flavivirga sp. MEBiC05379]MDO5980813.1 FecR family protein [Flavivirga sp. MEBiC05379]
MEDNMEDNIKIKELLLKFLKDDCSQIEIDSVVSYFQAAKKTKDFPTVENVFELFYEISKVDEATSNQIIKNILSDSKRGKRSKHSIWKYAAAAVVIGILSTSYLLRDNLFNNPQEEIPIIVNNTIQTGTDKAILTLEDGSIVELQKGKNFKTTNVESNGEEIIYASSKRNTKEIVHNYLTIPRGGQFFIELSDGTKVWLNSETQLKYPVAFNHGKTRQVELIYGEAYFDVSPSTEHGGAKFKVFNKSQEIEVLGTEFNIKAYKDETNIYTTLVEGKVDVSIDNRKQSLIPTQQLNLNLNTNTTIVKKIDVYGEISWKEGVFSFENKPLKDMMKVLSRWYDVDIIIKNKLIENEEFVGVLRKNQSLEKILISIKNSGVIKNFEIADKKVVLE